MNSGSQAGRELGLMIAVLAREADWHVEEEFRFAPPRRWRADWAIRPPVPGRMILIEFEGGRWQEGYHQTARYSTDCEKYNEATIRGFLVLRFTVEMVTSGMALTQIQHAMSIQELC